MVARPRPWVWRSALVLNALDRRHLGGVAHRRAAVRPRGPAHRGPLGPRHRVLAARGRRRRAARRHRPRRSPSASPGPVRDRWSARFTRGRAVGRRRRGRRGDAHPLLRRRPRVRHRATPTPAPRRRRRPRTTVALDGSTPCEQSGPAASPGQVATDAEGHSHRGPTAQQPITEAERIELAAQQEQARAAAARYPTVADAEADGYRMSVTFVPCIGAHYTNVLLARSFDPAHPSELLFDGTDPDSKIIGLSYLVYSGGEAPGRLRRPQRPLAPAQLQRRPLPQGRGRRRRRGRERRRLRGPGRPQGRPRRRVDAARLGRARVGVLVGRVRRRVPRARRPHRRHGVGRARPRASGIGGQQALGG